jgi:hypothetical protein
MTDSAPPFLLQALGTVGGLVLVVGIVAWQMRGDRKGFSLLRILGVAFAALLGSLPFVAAFWWFAPRDADRHSPLLLAAVFVPTLVLEAWGISSGIRRWRQRKHERTSA